MEGPQKGTKLLLTNFVCKALPVLKFTLLGSYGDLDGGMLGGQAARILRPGAMISGLRTSGTTGFGPLAEKLKTIGALSFPTTVRLWILKLAIGFLVVLI